MTSKEPYAIQWLGLFLPWRELERSYGCGHACIAGCSLWGSGGAAAWLGGARVAQGVQRASMTCVCVCVCVCDRVCARATVSPQHNAVSVCLRVMLGTADSEGSQATSTQLSPHQYYICVLEKAAARGVLFPQPLLPSPPLRTRNKNVTAAALVTRRCTSAPHVYFVFNTDSWFYF